MKHLPVVSAGIGLAVLVSCSARAPQAPGVGVRTVAFDNAYGASTSLRVHVSVDGGPERRHTASCTSDTCTFTLLLADGPHTLSLSVEEGGRRSTPTTITVGAIEAKRAQ